MKRFFILILLFTLNLYANEATSLAKKLHYSGAYETMLKNAQQKHQLLMLIVVEDDCHWCKKYARTTLSNKNIQKKLENVQKVIIDRYDTISLKHDSKFFPMTYFIDPKTSTIIQTLYGYKTTKLFLEGLHVAQQKLKAYQNGYVIDTQQHLMWDTCKSEDFIHRAFMHNAGKSLCENLYFMGYDDWRLPTPRELQLSIQNKTLTGLLAYDGYWTSKWDPKEPEDNILMVFASNGTVYAESSCERGHIICVR